MPKNEPKLEDDDDLFGGDDFDIVDPSEAGKSSPEKRERELSETLQKLKASLKNERDVFLENVDSEYWFCVCFQTREQKEEFLEKMKWLDLGDKYLDGLEVAERQELKLDNPTPPIRKRNISKGWEEFT